MQQRYHKSKAGWREIGGKKIYARSAWEANYARWLQYQKEHGMIANWAHEPKTFWFEGIKRGCVSYQPDFRVDKLNLQWLKLEDEQKIIKCGKSRYWIEVKGYMDPRSATKIKRFRKYFPNENLIIVDKDWFRCNSAKLKAIIKDWEISNAPQKRKIQEYYRR